MNLTNKELLGLINEKVFLAVFMSLFKATESFRIKHNDFNNYHDGISKGVDFRIFERNRSLFDIEVKNWKLFNKPYGLDVAEKEIVERFKNSCAVFKILIISFASLLSQPAIRLLRSHNIHVFSVDRLLGKKVFKTRFFYELRSKLAYFFHKLQKPADFFVQHDLSRFVVTTKSVVDVDTTRVNNYPNNNTSIPIKTKYDTPSQVSNQIEPDYTQYSWQLLREAIRYNMWKQSLREHGIIIED